MKNLIIIILALAFVAPMGAAEGRRTAFLGGLAVGIIGTVFVNESMESKPSRSEVVVEQAPRVVYVEKAPRRVVYVEVEYRHRRTHQCDNGFGWTPPIARPFHHGR